MYQRERYIQLIDAKAVGITVNDVYVSEDGSNQIGCCYA